MGFVFGIHELDRMFSKYLKPGYMIVLAGYPGAGKTTLASTMCYANALRGFKCLYISFFEDKDKHFDNMSKFGIDLNSLESKGLLNFVKLPIMYATDELSNMLIKLVREFKPNIIVVDSINALLLPILGGDKRIALQNTIYELPKAINGLVVLTAEVPEGYDVVDVGGIAYVADVVMLLKYRIERGLISRTLEIRKFRGAQITIYEMPFTIMEGSGIIAYSPPLLEELGSMGREVAISCESLRRALNHLHLGMHIYISYPPDFRPVITPMILVDIHVVNKLKGLVISYLYPPNVLKALVIRTLTLCGVGRDLAEKVVHDHFIIKSFNPFAYSINELILRELKLIEQYNADTVIFHGIDVSGTAYARSDYVRELYNQLNYLRSRGFMIFRLGSRVNAEIHRLNSAIADVVVNYVPRREGNYVKIEAYVWRRGTPTIHILTQEDLNKCCREIASIISTSSPCQNPQSLKELIS